MEVKNGMKTNPENKKTFIKPELEIIEFTNNDIITQSFGNPDSKPGSGGDIWTGWW